MINNVSFIILQLHHSCIKVDLSLNNWVTFFKIHSFLNVVPNIMLFFFLFHLNWSNEKDISLALWILMARCFDTRASVAIVLSMHPCVSSCLWVKWDMICFCTGNTRETWFQSLCSRFYSDTTGLGVWNHWQLHCLFSSLFRIITKKHESSALLAIC